MAFIKTAPESSRIHSCRFLSGLASRLRLAQVFQRQMSKEGLQTVVNNSSKDAGSGGGGGGGGADSGLAANLMSAGEHKPLGVRHAAAH